MHSNMICLNSDKKNLFKHLKFNISVHFIQFIIPVYLLIVYYYYNKRNRLDSKSDLLLLRQVTCVY